MTDIEQAIFVLRSIPYLTIKDDKFGDVEVIWRDPKNPNILIAHAYMRAESDVVILRVGTEIFRDDEAAFVMEESIGPGEA